MDFILAVAYLTVDDNGQTKINVEYFQDFIIKIEIGNIKTEIKYIFK